MSDKKTLQNERNQLFHDFYNNILPKRVPVNVPIPHQVVAQYGGIDPFEFQYDFSKLRDAAEKICDDLAVDACPIQGVSVLARIPAYYEYMDSQSFEMGGNGQVQHPEVSGMLPEDYDYLIEDPYACLLERIIPRQYKGLSLDNPVSRCLAMDASRASVRTQAMSMGPVIGQLIEKKGYYQGPPMGSGGFTEAPFDFIGDQLRGFSGVSMDIRRDKKRLMAACEAVLPLMYQFGLPDHPHPEGIISTPLHMPTFMRPKDVEEMWFPTYQKMLQQFSAKGARVRAFCEDNWMRYLDMLQDLPAGHILAFEYGDPKEIKEKLGNRFIITGLYPLELVKTGTPQQCIDKAKELLDIMLPGGGYIFGFDKVPMMASDINLENLIALLKFVRDYSVYENPGEAFGTALNSENFAVDESIVDFDSKYKFDWEAYKAKHKYVPESAKNCLKKDFESSFKDNLFLLF